MDQARLENSEGEESRDSSSPEERSTRTRVTRSRSEVRWRGSTGGRRWSSVSRLSGKQERDRRDKIERDNQILLRKILDCHHGHDRQRTSAIPATGRRGQQDMGSNNTLGTPGDRGVFKYCASMFGGLGFLSQKADAGRGGALLKLGSGNSSKKKTCLR